MEELCAQLAGVTTKLQTIVAADRSTHHTPLPIALLDPANPAHKPADTRKYCEHCKARRVYNKTPWQCGACRWPSATSWRGLALLSGMSEKKCMGLFVYKVHYCIVLYTFD